MVLGMSVDSFKIKFNLQPSGCATCEKGEQYASFYLDKNEANYFGKEPTIVKNLQNGKLTYLTTSFKPKVVHCYFYAGKLYSITFSGMRSTLASIQDKYINKLGKPTDVDVWDTGISQLRWENASTRLTVAYHTAEKGLDELDITYADVNIMAKMPDDTEH
jgi:alpha-glucosidase (family GH31 glycosyl hydrolase)